jgi:hypothetical protein
LCSFSPLAFAANSPPAIGAITPTNSASAVNQQVIFTTTYNDSQGCANIRYVFLLINTSGFTNCCYAYYDQSTNKFYLADNTAATWYEGFPGANKILQNSYAILDCSKSTVTKQNNTLTIQWVITFKPTFFGRKNTWLYVKDNSNYYQDWTQKGTYTIDIVDTTAPTGTIKINNDSQYANSTAVTLNLSASDNLGGSGLDQMQFSNEKTAWSSPKNYAVTTVWSLASGDGTKTVWAKFKDTAGNWSIAEIKDSIVLDTTMPSKPIVTDDGVDTSNSQQLHAGFSATDATSGISEYQYQIRQDSTTGAIIVEWTSTGTNTEITKISLNLINGKNYYFTVKAKNGAGLWSEIGYSDGIKAVLPDTIAPTGSIKINNDITHTNSVSVTLNLSAEDNLSGSGLCQMKFSDDNINWSVLEDYVTVKSWTLSSNDGEKRIYVKFNDNAGNWSQPSWDTIILDTVSPEINLLSPLEGSVVTGLEN